MKNLTLAKNAGFCFGVKRAVDKVLDLQKTYNKRIYTLGPLIHNNDVVEYLKENNIFPIKIEDINELNNNDVVVIRSHGVSPMVINTLSKNNLIIEDATCPHVSKIHKKVKEFKDLGYTIIIVGDKSHPEVVGINGWSNEEAIVTKCGEDLDEFNLKGKVCLVSQTTEKKENWTKVVNKLESMKIEFTSFNTICNATSVRQESANEVSESADLMVVIGGYDSSNTTKLYEICKANCENTIHVENAGEIPDDISNSNYITNIGVTAGASTPDWIIKEAIIKMSENKVVEQNEQLAYMNENDVDFSIGDVVSGEIISMSNNEAFINIGYKKDGKLPLSEVTKEIGLTMMDFFKINDEITAKVIRLSDSDGYVVLSRIEIARDKAYEELEKAYEGKETIEIELVEAVKGGIIARFKGVRVFLPASHVELFHVDDLKEYIGKVVPVKIIEFKAERKGTKIVASRRSLLQTEKIKNEEKAWETLETGLVVEGSVKRLTNFGAFVEVNGIDGLLHVSELSWGRIDKASDILKVGDKINVYVIEANKETKKLSLSIKKLTSNPWNNIVEKYPVGNIVLGKVVRFSNFGAFIELEPGVDGLVHISEISHKRIEKSSDVLTLNETIKAKILSVAEESKKIGLSIKEAEEI
ncbi:bifunctional 4-hydroxy-3-methylbut-2-enyl diphosphate reductase/30S ribosomal protein S1 [Clostridium grantii]|uniref:4-hydroxy-3-methylbut-2-enyl diphosphate reductase n=1 Tax=Clostridium grantii DSM 8605 TaxID=1121316 RepID=A0A1M5VPL0_9CLOT|nr:bifunctional 4-hydroxy-3-methylbut-2-enyl diphosphate reductase/30S ribosomal protein S1 [Clostridium grantii]SHH77182.1 4-hydroxy-3-methylbut-2-enyl diphosphate reductase [Clostridium grantii DSM 8605]